MKIHILGICGTFMGGIALLAKHAGHEVGGSDENVYPPMSTQLEEQGIALCQGYRAEHIPDDVDQVVIGNALSRGNAAVEHVLNKGIPYLSGPQWLAENVLQNRWVLAVAGTHGKTTTSSMLAWILDYAGMQPGFLIGGVPGNFGLSARLGEPPFFVVEADEYDTAFFDKRSKFVHYRPRTAVLNNLEFDHADIFDDLAAIEKQFHHLVRTVPGEGLLVVNADDANLPDVLAQGCWTPPAFFSSRPAPPPAVAAGADFWSQHCDRDDGSRFDVRLHGEVAGVVNWSQHGRHNRMNALAAIIAARHAGVAVEHACEALSHFAGIRRRLEVAGVIAGITVYDDFAHHPTAIRETLAAMQELRASGRVLVILEPRSNTMKMGVHGDALAAAFGQADRVSLFQPPQGKPMMDDVARYITAPVTVHASTQAIIDEMVAQARAGDHIVIMSNGGFEAIHRRLLAALQQRYGEAVLA